MQDTKDKDCRTDRHDTIYSIVEVLRKMSNEQFSAFLNDPKDRPVGDIVSYLFNHLADLLVMADRWDKEALGDRGSRIANLVVNTEEARKAIVAAKEFINRDFADGCGCDRCKATKEIVDYLTSVLNTPIRNCDRFGGDPNRLHDEWFEWTGTEAGTNHDGTVRMTFADWLLATWDGTEMFPKKSVPDAK